MVGAINELFLGFLLAGGLFQKEEQQEKHGEIRIDRQRTYNIWMVISM